MIGCVQEAINGNGNGNGEAATQQAISEMTLRLASQEIIFAYDEHKFRYTFADFLSHIHIDEEYFEPVFDVIKIYNVLTQLAYANKHIISLENIDKEAAIYDAMVILTSANNATGSADEGDGYYLTGDGNNYNPINNIVILYEKWIREEVVLHKDVLGSFYTYFTAGETGRNANLQRAADFINNVTIAPNEIFNMTDTIGPINKANGYQVALVIRDGEFVEGIGGGVCQVSSTLYMAALFAELEIVQRRAHSRKVGYMPPAFDAVLSIPTLNLRFKNNTDSPITIETIVDFRTSRLTVNILGRETRPEGRTISFNSVRVNTTSEWMTYHLYKFVNYNGTVTRTRVNISSYRVEQAGEITYYEAIGAENETDNYEIDYYETEEDENDPDYYETINGEHEPDYDEVIDEE